MLTELLMQDERRAGRIESRIEGRFEGIADQLLTKRNPVKQYSIYNMYKSSGQIIMQTTRYPVNQRCIIEFE